jgi:hypothetical protein
MPLHEAIERALLANDATLLGAIPGIDTNGSHAAAGKANGAHPASEVRVPDSAPDPDIVVGELEKFIRRFVIMPDLSYLPMAMWILATHAADAFECFPYLALLSPAKRCGKTRLLEVLEMLVKGPWRGTAPTPAALYRMMAESPTLLLDEVEALNSRNQSESAQAILAILNAGHRKGATIPRCDGPKHELKHFPVYGPKAFAAIGRLPDTLLDRSIRVPMQRRTQNQKVERFLAARAGADAKPIREAAASFGARYSSDIGRAYQQLMASDLEFLGDRDADLWIPLFAVCSIGGPERLPELKRCAIALSTSKSSDDGDDSLPLKLLADIRAVWPEDRDRCDTATLIAKLKSLEESPWGSEIELTPRKLARMLKPFDVEARTIRIGESALRGYEFDPLAAAFSRYLEIQSATSATNQ